MFAEKGKSFELDLVSAGHDRVGPRWRGMTENIRYTRLFFVRRGSFYIASPSGERTDLTPGYAYLIPSGYAYSYGTDEPTDYIYLHLRLSDFDCIDTLSRLMTPRRVRFDYDLDKLTGAIDNYTLTSSITLNCVIYTILSDIASESAGVLNKPAYSPLITAAIEYISEHLTVRLTLREICDALYTSKSRLTSLFHDEVGMSVGKYIDYRVMISAECALADGEQSILDISDSLGFCDQFYFSRRFKEKHGVSPREFRKSAKNSQICK
jgi:AraC-like DNA-binding protein